MQGCPEPRPLLSVIAAVLIAQIFFNGGVDPLATVVILALLFAYATTPDG